MVTKQQKEQVFVSDDNDMVYMETDSEDEHVFVQSVYEIGKGEYLTQCYN